MSVRLCTPLVLLLALTACAPRGVRTSPTPSVAEVERLSREVTQAGDRLRAGIDAAQPAAVAEVLAPDVVLVTMNRDTLRGRDQVVSFLTASGQRQPLRIFPGTIGACPDGTLQEFGGQFTGAPLTATPAAPFSQGQVLVQWDISADGARATHVDLGPGPDANRRASCSLLHLTSAMYQRVIATFALEMGARSPSGIMRSVDQAMLDRGFRFEGFPTSESNAGGATGSVRLRVTPWLSTELQGTIRRQERSESVHPSRFRHVLVSSRPVALTQLVQVQWKSLRLGAGPSWLMHNFRVEELHERYVGPESGTWYKESNERFTSQSSAGTMGMMVEGAFSIPLGARAILELRGGTATYGKTTIPGTPNWEAVTGVSRTLGTAAVAVGFGW